MKRTRRILLSAMCVFFLAAEVHAQAASAPTPSPSPVATAGSDHDFHLGEALQEVGELEKTVEVTFRPANVFQRLGLTHSRSGTVSIKFAVESPEGGGFEIEHSTGGNGFVSDERNETMLAVEQKFFRRRASHLKGRGGLLVLPEASYVFVGLSAEKKFSLNGQPIEEHGKASALTLELGAEADFPISGSHHPVAGAFAWAKAELGVPLNRRHHFRAGLESVQRSNVFHAEPGNIGRITLLWDVKVRKVILTFGGIGYFKIAGAEDTRNQFVPQAGMKLHF